MKTLSLQLFSLFIAGLMVLAIGFAVEPKTKLEFILVITVGLLTFRPIAKSCYKFHKDM